MDLVHIDTAEPYPTSLGGSRYVEIFVGSVSRLHQPYGFLEKSASAIFAVVKRVEADMGILRALRAEPISRMRCSWTIVKVSGSGASSPHGPVESAVTRAFKVGHATRLGFHKLFPDVHFEEARGCTDDAGTSI